MSTWFIGSTTAHRNLPLSVTGTGAFAATFVSTFRRGRHAGPELQGHDSESECGGRREVHVD